MPSLARTERAALCDLALELGGSAPTLCGDWTVKDLVVHLLVRERSLVGAPGIVIPALAGVTDRVSAKFARADLPLLVDQLRRPVVSPSAVGPLDRLLNTAEFFVHHEDLRRARPGWEPRPLAPPAQDTLWRLVRTAGKGLARPAGVPVVAEDARTGARAVLRRGAGAAVLRGLPAEILLHLYGRAEVAGLEYTGPEDAVRRLRDASLGV